MRVTIDEAVDAVECIARSGADVETMARLWRKAKREGRSLDIEKATTIMRACLRDMMSDIAIIAAGSSDDRERLCDEVAAAMVRKVVEA